ncbi:hypothetical protein diail_10042 [Diaporthe ilicicola]|nr:hypothetical protein diail_10042 [Diaporthe ilicicola]
MISSTAHIFTLALGTVGFLPSGAQAWGAFGHETVAYVATNFVAASTKTYFQSLLGDTSADYLATVSTWADSYRTTTAGKFSAPFHFIDAQDSPPSSCGVDYDRDCGSGGCVISAIQNYTSILLDTSESKASRQLAAKVRTSYGHSFSRHCENLDVGGNDIDVTYDGDSTNLHAVWDTQIPEAIAGSSSLSGAKTWAATLTTAINTGTYKSSAAGWVSGLNINDAVTSSLKWATESNAAVCSTVLAKGISYVESNDLSGSYTTTASPVVQLQIAKQGYRLAKWLDAIVAAV